MATELTEYELQQIRKSIDKFSQIVTNVSKKVESNKYTYDISKTEEFLSRFEQEEKSALKSAQKTIEKVFGSTNWWSSDRNNLNAILKQKGDDCAREIERIIKRYVEDLDNIVRSLPEVGVFNKEYHAYTEPEYSGDTEFISIASFDLNENTSVQKTECRDKETEKDICGHFVNSTKPESSEINISHNIYLDTYTTDDTVTVLSTGAISDVKIRKLICSQVKEIQANAFKRIQGLEVIVLSSSIQVINVNAFRGLENKCIIAFYGSKTEVIKTINSVDALANRKVIFGYKNGDETLNKAGVFVLPEDATKSKPKRIIIRENTPLDNFEIKQAFLSRNSKYGITMEELEQGILNAGTNVSKSLILMETLKIKRLRDLKEHLFWDYAEALQKIIKLSAELKNTEEELSAICALFFLDSSGYRMVNGKYNPYKQDFQSIYFHPKMQMKDLGELQSEKHLGNTELTEAYRKSPYVIELAEQIKDGYYSLDTSIQLMIAAMEHPDTIFYPAQTKFKRQN